MNAVISALAKSLGQLLDPAVVRVLVKSLLVTLAAFVLLAWGLWTLGEAWLQWAMLAFLPEDYAGPAAAMFGLFLSVVLFWLSFRVVALAVLQFFADEIVIAVEERHYPSAAAKARKLPFTRELANSLRGIGRALVFNALALPVAIVLAFTAIGPAIVFLLVNAVLLGRELTDMAVIRHSEQAPTASPVPAFQRLVLGGIIAAIMAVPFVNFLAPILGAAAGTHLAHGAMAATMRDQQEPAHDA